MTLDHNAGQDELEHAQAEANRPGFHDNDDQDYLLPDPEDYRCALS
jgi:hypothetical protein